MGVIFLYWYVKYYHSKKYCDGGRWEVGGREDGGSWLWRDLVSQSALIPARVP